MNYFIFRWLRGPFFICFFLHFGQHFLLRLFGQSSKVECNPKTNIWSLWWLRGPFSFFCILVGVHCLPITWSSEVGIQSMNEHRGMADEYSMSIDQGVSNWAPYWQFHFGEGGGFQIGHPSWQFHFGEGGVGFESIYPFEIEIHQFTQAVSDFGDGRGGKLQVKWLMKFWNHFFPDSIMASPNTIGLPNDIGRPIIWCKFRMIRKRNFV